MDYATITTLGQAEAACREGHLVKALLLPAELGGEDVPQNRTFLPPQASDAKAGTTVELINAVQIGMSAVSIVPEYRGDSFVPSRLVITAARPGSAPGLSRDLRVW